jgi:hypothetical protein
MQPTPPSSPPTFFAQRQLHACRKCNTPATIYLAERTLKAHTTRTHLTVRTDSNTAIIVHTLRHTTEATWTSNLQWLHHLNIQPPSFSGNLWRRLG